MTVLPPDIPAPSIRRIRRALLSVSDKTRLVTLAVALKHYDIEIISTGNTSKALASEGIAVRNISDVTGFPEIMDGRVKTLHPMIHGGILAIRDNPVHAETMTTHGIDEIDLVVVNLYPFEEMRRQGADYATIVENIDIGGPAMIRAAAKNHAYVAIVTDPEDYDLILAQLSEYEGCMTYSFRQQLAAKAFAHTAAYDDAIADWFSGTVLKGPPSWRAIIDWFADTSVTDPHHPAWHGFAKQLHSRMSCYSADPFEPGIRMRYGENPHQQGDFYRIDEKREHRPGAATATQLQGKPLSYNNINDTDAAFELIAEFDPKRTAAVAIIKHANPCGVAEGVSPKEAYLKALACDPMSAFGGIVVLNHTLDAQLAAEIVKIFTEVIIAPDTTQEAQAIIATKRNLRLLITGGLPDPRAPSLVAKTIAGGLLVQSRDNIVIDDLELKKVTKRAPTEAEMADLKFAFRVVKHVKSNAIVYAKKGATIGIGAGQMSRIDAVQIATRKAQDMAKTTDNIEPLLQGSVVASDAFFPFPDGLLSIIETGATAVIQPGGSIRDEEVIAAADAHDIAMVFTGVRHFKH